MTEKSRSVPNRRSNSKASPVVDPRRGFARRWLLLALVALCVARPLLPSEGVAYLGDGLPFDMLTLVFGAGFFAAACGRKTSLRPIDAADLGVVMLVLVFAASGVASAGYFGAWDHGSQRPALNMIWEWVALGMIYLLARQLIARGEETRAVVAVMFSLAVVMAGYGFYQILVSLPADRAAYAADPERVMTESLGQTFAVGSPERQRFENRLQSTEPLATFALANSLAGFLAPWLIVAAGVGLANWRKVDAGKLPRALALAACLAAVAVCLVLTKSRSAYVAAAGGILLLSWATGFGDRIWRPKTLAVLAATIVVVIGAALAFGNLDTAVLSEAGKSLGYRWQYWQSTLSMVRRYPWLGVGSGNFQDYYTAFKLPQASEEIRDPHNFLLEAWSTGGILALVALLGVLGRVGWLTWKLPAESIQEVQEAKQPHEGDGAGTRFILAGALVGFGLAFLLAPMPGLEFGVGLMLSGMAVSAVVIALAWPWIAQGELPARLPAVALAVLSIHWLASGGFTFPGVAQSFWLLLALALNEVQPIAQQRGEADSRWPWLGPVAGLVVMSAAAAGCYFSAYDPVQKCRLAMAVATAPASAMHTPTVEMRIAALLRAAEADPLAADPWILIGELELGRLKQQPKSAEIHNEFVDATTKIFARRPRSSSSWRQVARWYGELFGKSADPDAAAASAECYRRAVELYPNLAALRGEFALALETTGQATPARRNAERALQLDRLTPHADQKLPDALRDKLEALVKASPGKRNPSPETAADKKLDDKTDE